MIKKNRYKGIKMFALGAVLMLGASSCYELEPNFDSELRLEALNSENDILKAETPIYRSFLTMYNSHHIMQITGYGADDITTWSAGNKAPLRVYDQLNYGGGENADNAWLAQNWAENYKVIYYANTVIEGLKTSQAPAEAIAVGEAEAKFFRGLCYLNLTRAFGNVPDILDDNTEAAIYAPRAASVLTNYLHIEKDLLFALSNLPAPGSEAQGHVTSAAAKTAIANLYLTWAGWPVKDNSKYAEAAKYSKEVIDLNYFKLLPIADLWNYESQNSLESVFSTQYSISEGFKNGTPAATSFHEARGWSDCFPELQFYADFPEGPRKQYTFFDSIPQLKWSNGQMVFKNPAYKYWTESQREHPMFKKYALSFDPSLGNRVASFRAKEWYRYAEVLLIYAEAQYRANGMDASVLNAVNQIRRRAAGLPFDTPDASVDLTSVTADEIVQEKAWELAGENKRWWDLVRLEKVADAAAKRDPNEHVALITPADQVTWHQYISPIPQSEIDKNKELVQNPEGFNIK